MAGTMPAAWERPASILSAALTQPPEFSRRNAVLLPEAPVEGAQAAKAAAGPDLLQREPLLPQQPDTYPVFRRNFCLSYSLIFLSFR